MSEVPLYTGPTISNSGSDGGARLSEEEGELLVVQHLLNLTP